MSYPPARSSSPRPASIFGMGSFMSRPRSRKPRPPPPAYDAIYPSREATPAQQHLPPPPLPQPSPDIDDDAFAEIFEYNLEESRFQRYIFRPSLPAQARPMIIYRRPINRRRSYDPDPVYNLHAGWRPDSTAHSYRVIKVESTRTLKVVARLRWDEQVERTTLSRSGNGQFPMDYIRDGIVASFRHGGEMITFVGLSERWDNPIYHDSNGRITLLDPDD